MANVLFNLKSKKEALTNIILIYHYAPYSRFVYYTGEKVAPKNWSIAKSKVKSSHPGSSALINQYLDKLRVHCEDIRREMLINGVLLSKAEFKEQLELRIGISQNDIYWYALASNYYELLKEEKGKFNTKGLLSHITKMKKVIPDMKVSQLGMHIFKSAERKFLDKELSPNYINKLMSTMKVILKYGLENDYNVNLDFQKVTKIKMIKTKDQIFCTMDELVKMHTFDYSSDYKRNAAYAFLIGAFTSLRVSEFMEVVRDPNKHIYTIEGVKMIKVLSSQKTKKKAAIPLHYIIEDILNSYTVRPISDQKLNKYLKEIGEDIGMDQEFTRIEQRGRKEIEVTYKRYELLSSHTARRSFVTNMYIMNVPLSIIRMFTTHSTEAQLLQYMKMNVEMNAINMADHQFFNRPKLRKVD